MDKIGEQNSQSYLIFRHTFAMQLLDKGIDIYTISTLLGHKQVSSTQSYAKISSKKMIEAILRIE